MRIEKLMVLLFNVVAGCAHPTDAIIDGGRSARRERSCWAAVAPP